MTELKTRKKLHVIYYQTIHPFISLVTTVLLDRMEESQQLISHPKQQSSLVDISQKCMHWFY